MIEYYAQTNSIRIVDVLVKVQIPHDKYIFDKLEKYLHVDSNQKVTALNLFGYIVRKHPTWLHKVVSHSFFKILLKLLKVNQQRSLFPTCLQFSLIFRLKKTSSPSQVVCSISLNCCLSFRLPSVTSCRIFLRYSTTWPLGLALIHKSCPNVS